MVLLKRRCPLTQATYSRVNYKFWEVLVTCFVVTIIYSLEEVKIMEIDYKIAQYWSKAVEFTVYNLVFVRSVLQVPKSLPSSHCSLGKKQMANDFPTWRKFSGTEKNSPPLIRIRSVCINWKKKKDQSLKRDFSSVLMIWAFFLSHSFSRKVTFKWENGTVYT